MMFKSMTRPAAGIAAAAAMIPGLALAAEPPCLTPPEFTALATYALPVALSATARRCGPSLPADAFLNTGGTALIARYGPARDAAWPGARAAFLRLAGGEAIPVVKSLPDSSLQQIADSAITARIADVLPLERCGAVDRLIQLVSPLPPESTAGLIGLAIGLGTRSGRGRIGPFAVCPQ